MTDLNEPQRVAVSHERGPLLVFAGAGSGKTRVITYRVANLLATHHVPPYRILAVTFTNKAAGEMRERLEKLAGEDVSRDLWVGTFHSVCARLLRRYHAEVGLGREYVIYDDSDQKAVMTRLIRERGLSERSYPPKLVLSRIHRQKHEGVGPDEVETRPSFDEKTVELYADYQKALRTANAVDFDDLILHVMRLAEDSQSEAGRELRQRYRHVLVDEFQDTNAIQYRLVRALAAEDRNLCVVGDDDQSIYSWRGADVRNILGFKRDYPDATVVKLEQNYRSTKNIVAAALGVISGAAHREKKEIWSDGERGDEVVVRAVRDERDEAGFVVRRSKELIAAGHAASEIAVFYRVNAQSRVLEEALRSENVPYQVLGGMRFFERAEVKDLLAYLRLIDNPRSDADLMRIINVPTRGIGAKTVERLLSTAAERDTSAYDAIEATAAALGKAAKKKLGAFKQLIDDLRETARAESPRALANAVLDSTGYREQLRNADTAESDARLENLEELIGSLSEYEHDAEDAGETATLSGYLERVSLVSDVDSMKDVECITLMTVHSAKGLEFSTVFLTGMEEEIFPYRGLDSDSLEELDEERRLAYVAITRAKERLHVTHASMRMLFGQTRYLAPSRFLSDLPDDATRNEGAPWQTAARSTGRYGYGATPSSASSASSDLEPGESRVDYDAFDDMAYEREGAVQPGDKVFHRRFGRGVVQSIQQGDQPTVVALFPGWGPKKVRAEYLTFE